jgi:putative transposase
LRSQLRKQSGRHKHATAGCLDSQSVKSKSLPGVRGFDAHKNINGRKRHILVDTLGLLLLVVVTAASVQDRDGAKLLLRQLRGAGKKLRRIWVDGAYRGELLNWAATHCRAILQPVLRTDQKKGFLVLPRRWVVERTFSWFNHARRLSKDYEVLTTSSESMIYIAMTRLMLRRLASG